MCRQQMIEFYGESRSVKKASSTAKQNVEKLNRVFRMLETAYGVCVRAVDAQKHKFVIEGLEAPVLQDWYNKFAEGRKMSTLNNYVNTINPFLRWAFSQRYIDEDYSNVLSNGSIPDIEDLPEWERPKDKYLTHEQAKALIEEGSGYNHLRDRAFIALILYTGLRCEEACSFTLADVLDRPRGTLHFKRKGGKWQTVPVNPDVYRYVDEYLRTRDLEDHSKPLFMTTRGQPCSPKQMYKALSARQKKLGIATGAHALRHTWESEMEKIGGVGVARDLAGQKSIKVSNRYIHSTEDQRRDASNKLRW